jgi:glucose/mannose-6-phosphate isomerase
MHSPSDPSGMHENITAFPQQFAAGYAAASSAGAAHADKTFDRIVVAGVGGSALPGDFLTLVAPTLGLTLPIVVHRDYGLPQFVKNGLVVVISYSGNTEEALSAYDAAQKENLAIIAITTGGSLKERAQRDGVELVLVPSGVQSRMALGYQFSALLHVLENIGIVASQKDALEQLATTLDPARAQKDAEALLPGIRGTTPLFYASRQYYPLAHILKIQMNENAKVHAFANMFPELNHNEMVGYEAAAPEHFSTVILTADDDTLIIKKRQALTAQLIKEKGGRVHVIDIVGEDIYDRIFNIVLLGSWLSYHLAVDNGIDPAPVRIIESFKKALGE